MAEPGLSLGFTDIRLQVAQAMGLSRDSTKWTTDETAVLAELIDSGARQFYHPPVLLTDKAIGNMQPHKWSFLEPVDTITVWGTTTGTVTGLPSYSAGTGLSTITVTASAFHDTTMIGKSFTFDTSGTSYVIAGYTSATVLTVTGDASGETTGDTYTITANGDYPMADDFGGVIGPFTLGADEGYNPVVVVSDSEIRLKRQLSSSTTGIPVMAAYIPLITDQSVTQRYDLRLYPIPDGDYNLSYRKRVLLDKLTAANPYPWGGMPHAETLLQSCLSVVEERMDNERGVQYAKFLERLETSVGFDRDVGTPDLIGYNGDSGGSSVASRPIRYVTYNDVLYEG